MGDEDAGTGTPTLAQRLRAEMLEVRRQEDLVRVGKDAAKRQAEEATRRTREEEAAAQARRLTDAQKALEAKAEEERAGEAKRSGEIQDLKALIKQQMDLHRAELGLLRQKINAQESTIRDQQARLDERENGYRNYVQEQSAKSALHEQELVVQRQRQEELHQQQQQLVVAQPAAQATPEGPPAWFEAAMSRAMASWDNSTKKGLDKVHAATVERR